MQFEERPYLIPVPVASILRRDKRPVKHFGFWIIAQNRWWWWHFLLKATMRKKWEHNADLELRATASGRTLSKKTPDINCFHRSILHFAKVEATKQGCKMETEINIGLNWFYSAFHVLLEWMVGAKCIAEYISKKRNQDMICWKEQWTLYKHNALRPIELDHYLQEGSGKRSITFRLSIIWTAIIKILHYTFDIFRDEKLCVNAEGSDVLQGTTFASAGTERQS